MGIYTQIGENREMGPRYYAPGYYSDSRGLVDFNSRDSLNPTTATYIDPVFQSIRMGNTPVGNMTNVFANIPLGASSQQVYNNPQMQSQSAGFSSFPKGMNEQFLNMYVSYLLSQQVQQPKDTCADSVSVADVQKKTGFSQAAAEKLLATCDKLKCKPDDLMAIIKSESGFSTTAKNKSGATGLIQFMPSTAEDLGTTTDALAKMSDSEQMDYVEKYLLRAKKQAKFSDDKSLSGGELYGIIFMPGKMRNGDGVLATRGTKAFSQNEKALNVNGGDTITVADLDARVDKMTDSLT